MTSEETCRRGGKTEFTWKSSSGKKKTAGTGVAYWDEEVREGGHKRRRLEAEHRGSLWTKTSAFQLKELGRRGGEKVRSPGKEKKQQGLEARHSGERRVIWKGWEKKNRTPICGRRKRVDRSKRRSLLHCHHQGTL